ncbi:MAG: hypothetical protein R3F16_07760 [Myxococcota bacterium]
MGDRGPRRSLLERALAGGLVAVALLAASCREGGESAGPPDAPAGPTGDLVAVAWTDESRLLVATAAGAIHLSRDAGEHWSRAHLPATRGLQALDMADAQAGWALARRSVLRTEDGGASWRRQRLPRPETRLALTGLAAIDGRRAVAIDADGLRWTTRDGGGVWRRVEAPPAVEAGPAESGGAAALLASIACQRDAGSAGEVRCWAAGRVVEESRDGGETWQPVVLRAAVELPSCTFEYGRVVVPRETAAAWAESLAGLRHRDDLQFRIEAGLSSAELEGIASEGDTAALFERLEARLEELRGVLEDAGIPGDRIRLVGAPRWEYEDYLDETPHRLERYWQGRLALGPRGRIEVVESSSIRGLVASPDERDGAVVVGVGDAGRVVEGPGSSPGSGDEPGAVDGARAWRSVPGPPAPHGLLAVAAGDAGLVAVGEQGGLWRRRADDRAWERPVGPPPFFETLRAVAFSPSGRRGVAVGDGGRLLRSLDGGASWSIPGGEPAAPVDTAPQDGHPRVR